MVWVPRKGPIGRGDTRVWLLPALFAICLLAETVTPAMAGRVQLVDRRDSYELGTHLALLEDATGAMTIEQVASGDSNPLFEQSKVRTPNFGYTRSVWWARVTLENATVAQHDWMLEVAYAPLDRIDLFRLEGSDFHQITVGDQFPFANRPMAYRFFLFPLRIEPGQRTTVYLRFQTEGTMRLPLNLRTPAAQAVDMKKDMFGLGLYYGVMLAMLGYNFFLLIWVRDRTYLFYELYISGFILLMLTANGLAAQYLWPEATRLNNVALPLFSGFGFLTIAYFAQTFLHTRDHARRLHRVLDALKGVGLLLMVVSLLDYGMGLRMMSLVGVLVPLLLLTAGWLVWRDGFEPALYFLLAWGGLMAGGLVVNMISFGWVPSNFITANGMQIGSALEVIMLSIGLAERIKKLKRDRSEAREEARLVRVENEALESEVLARTRVLQARNQELETLDRIVKAINRETGVAAPDGNFVGPGHEADSPGRTGRLPDVGQQIRLPLHLGPGLLAGHPQHQPESGRPQPPAAGTGGTGTREHLPHQAPGWSAPLRCGWRTGIEGLRSDHDP